MPSTSSSVFHHLNSLPSVSCCATTLNYHNSLYKVQKEAPRTLAVYSKHRIWKKKEKKEQIICSCDADLVDWLDKSCDKIGPDVCIASGFYAVKIWPTFVSGVEFQMSANN